MIERRGPVRIALTAALLATVLAGCAAGTDSATAPAPAPPAPTPTATPSPTPTIRVLELTYAGGKVTGDTGRQQVRLGEKVVLRVTGDVVEEVHVHGYDVSKAVPAGGTVEVPITASIPGGFEVELHEAGTALCQLRVA